MTPRGPSEDPKVTALRESRCLNPHPEHVADEAFLADGFFDARDAVQVKYEMVRRVSVDGAPVTATAAAFGYSRPSYYQAAAGLAESGLDGLVPARPGPRRSPAPGSPAPGTAGTPPSPGRHGGAGLIPAFLRICQTVDGATVMPSPASSPWIRR